MVNQVESTCAEVELFHSYSRLLFVDIECCGSQTLLSSSLSEYVKDADITTVSWISFVGAEKTEGFVDYLSHHELSVCNTPGHEKLMSLLGDDNALKIAHNAIFDRTVLRKKFPSVSAKNWFCTKAFANYCGLPSILGQLVDMFLPATPILDKEGNEIVGPRFKEELATTRKFMSKKKVYALIEKGVDFKNLAEWSVFLDYCRNDTRATCKLFATFLALPVFRKQLANFVKCELANYDLDTKVNEAGIPVDYELAEQLNCLMDTIKETYIQRTEKSHPFLNLNSTAQIKKLLFDQEGIDVDSLDESKIDDLLQREDLSDDSRNVLQARKIVGKRSVDKARSVTLYGNGEPIRYTMRFLGAATTGRWAGRYTHFLNVKKTDFSISVLSTFRMMIKHKRESVPGLEEFFGVPIDKIVPSLVKTLVSADQGNKLIISDLKTIEPVLLFFILEDLPSLQLCMEGDPYKFMAAGILGKSENDVTHQERKMAKPAFLGCGYGMGAKRLRGQAKEDGVILTLEEATTHRNSYHSLFPSVSRFFRELKSCITRALQNPEEDFLLHGLVIRKEIVNYHGLGHLLTIRLLSGRKLCYREMYYNIAENKFGYLNQFHIENLVHGGQLTSHIVQATARDVLCNILLNLDREGFDIRLHVYDSVVCTSAENTIEEKKSLFDRIFGKVPGWMEGERFPYPALRHDSCVSDFFM